MLCCQELYWSQDNIYDRFDWGHSPSESVFAYSTDTARRKPVNTETGPVVLTLIRTSLQLQVASDTLQGIETHLGSIIVNVSRCIQIVQKPGLRGSATKAQ